MTNMFYLGSHASLMRDLPESRLRTDDDFLMQRDEEYHRGETVLKEIPNFGLVSNVTLDYMHLVCLGVTKKILLLWMKGPLSVRIHGTIINQISGKLLLYKKSTPREFSRKPRSLADIKYWKATEFRQFLLYTGPIVLKEALDTEKYVHFLTFHIAISILINPNLVTVEDNIKYAEELLCYFVKKFANLYGKKFISHNIHNLVHLAAEVRKYGVLDNFSAFHFENFLGQLKKKLRKAEKPLQQIGRRISEMNICPIQQLRVNNYKLDGKHFSGPLLPFFRGKQIIQYKSVQTNVIYLNCDDLSNNTIILKRKRFAL